MMAQTEVKSPQEMIAADSANRDGTVSGTYKRRQAVLPSGTGIHGTSGTKPKNDFIPLHNRDASAAVLNGLIEALADRVAARLSEGGPGAGRAQVATRLLSLKEAAVYLSLSLSTIKNMLVSSELKVVSRGGRRMIDIQDLDLWIERHKD